MITYVSQTELQIRHHEEEAYFSIRKLGHYPLVLGILWRRHHDIAIKYSQNRFIFDSERCCKHHNA